MPQKKLYSPKLASPGYDLCCMALRTLRRNYLDSCGGIDHTAIGLTAGRPLWGYGGQARVTLMEFNELNMSYDLNGRFIL